MEIKQIIVDKLPDNCRKCDLMFYDMSQQNYLCYVTKKKIYPSLMPTWCPLEIVEECVWSGNFVGYDENGDALFITKKTSCSDVHIQTVNIPDYKYCPNCGKRIRYEGEK